MSFEFEGFVDSLLFTVVRTLYYCIIIIFTSMLLGYIFAKVDFIGKKIVFIYFMISMMVPAVATIIPTFVLYARFPLVGGNNILGLGGRGFINNWSVMFISGLFGIYNIFLVRQNILDIPDDYREAGEIDGANMFRIIFQIYMPMLKPILTVINIGLILGFWNDYFFSKLYAYGDVIKPIGYYVTEVMASFQNVESIYPNYPAVLGVAVVFMLPPILFYLGVQKNFVDGFSIGGIKG